MAPEPSCAIEHLPRARACSGALIDDPRPIRLTHLADDPRSVGLPRRAPADGQLPRRPDPGPRRGLRQPLPDRERRAARSAPRTRSWSRLWPPPPRSRSTTPGCTRRGQRQRWLGPPARSPASCWPRRPRRPAASHRRTSRPSPAPTSSDARPATSPALTVDVARTAPGRQTWSVSGPVAAPAPGRSSRSASRLLGTRGRTAVGVHGHSAVRTSAPCWCCRCGGGPCTGALTFGAGSRPPPVQRRRPRDGRRLR